MACFGHVLGEHSCKIGSVLAEHSVVGVLAGTMALHGGGREGKDVQLEALYSGAIFVRFSLWISLIFVFECVQCTT